MLAPERNDVSTCPPQWRCMHGTFKYLGKVTCTGFEHRFAMILILVRNWLQSIPLQVGAPSRHQKSCDSTVCWTSFSVLKLSAQTKIHSFTSLVYLKFIIFSTRTAVIRREASRETTSPLLLLLPPKDRSTERDIFPNNNGHCSIGGDE